MSIDWGGLGTVFGVGLVAGVGLLALFALGVRVLATQPSGHRSRVALVAATTCFVICAVVGAYGIHLLLAK